jgi:hypothetical protein
MVHMPHLCKYWLRVTFMDQWYIRVNSVNISFIASYSGIIMMYFIYASKSTCMLNIFTITWSAILVKVMMVVSLHSKVLLSFIEEAKEQFSTHFFLVFNFQTLLRLWNILQYRLMKGFFLLV